MLCVEWREANIDVIRIIMYEIFIVRSDHARLIHAASNVDTGKTNSVMSTPILVQ